MTTTADLRLPLRPQLKPALRRVWRDGETLQLGVEPPHAVMLTGLGPAELQLLDLLDGSRETGAVVEHAASLGLDAAAARALLERLARAGLLDDGGTDARSDQRDQQRLQPDRLSLSLRHRNAGAADMVLARRRRAAVTVHGAGRVGATVGTLLGAAGVGRISCVDERSVRTADLSPAGICDDVTASRGAAAAARISRCAPSTLTHTAPFASPTLVIVAPAASVAPPETLATVRRHPHVLVAIRETTAAVGPFVVPGRTPCIRCLELSRSDRDRQWPSIAAQLIAAGRAPEPCDVALATLAASLVTLHALAWIDSDRTDLPPSAGGVLELGLSDIRLRRRSLAAHPACGCGVLGTGDTVP
ncbi:MAG: hypothetical protein QOF18_2294 [Frankiaceae bacterium]|nr:hypothetical protein [Frankiaceae bacterium]